MRSTNLVLSLIGLRGEKIMLTYLRNVLPGFSRDLGCSVQSKAAGLLKQANITHVNKEHMVIKDAPQWTEVARQLEEDLSKCELGKIIKFISLSKIKEPLKQTKPDACIPADGIAISKICTVIARTNRYMANRDEGKFWYTRALEFNKANERAQQGLRGILSEEGDPSIIHKDYKSASARIWPAPK